MSRIDIDQVDVLTAIVDRLQSVLTLSDRQCYPVARPLDIPSIPPGGDYWLTVAPGGGSFEPEEQSAGNITEDSEVIVSAYTRIKTDSTGHDRYLLMDDARGLLAIKKLLLGALCGHDLTTEAGSTFLRQLVFAKRADSPDIVEAGPKGIYCGVIRITFGVPFDWSVA